MRRAAGLARWRRLGIAGAAAALLVSLPSPAAAHTELQWSRPADGEVVVGSPAEVRLRFTSAVEPRYTQVVFLGPDGGEIALPPLTVGEGRREFFSAVPAPLPPGPYTVHWRTAGADGHVIQGSFGFIIEPDPDAPEPVATPDAPVDPAAVQPEPAPPAITFPGYADPGSPLSTAVRFLHFTALLLLIGAVAFRFRVLRPLPHDDRAAAVGAGAAAGVRALASAALATLGGVILARLWLQSVALHGVEQAWDPARLSVLLADTVWGNAWLLQVAAAALVLVGLLLAFGNPAADRGWLVAGIGVLGLAVVPGLSGHAVAVERIGWVAVANDSLHVLAAGTWLGSLAMLLFAGLPAALRDGGEQRLDATATLVNRFSPLALGAASVLVATGVVNALFHFGALPELWITAYGRTLLLKIAVLLPVIGLGAYNWRVVRPALGGARATRHLQRSAGAEISIGVLVVVVTAVLVAVPRP